MLFTPSEPLRLHQGEAEKEISKLVFFTHSQPLRLYQGEAKIEISKLVFLTPSQPLRLYQGEAEKEIRQETAAAGKGEQRQTQTFSSFFPQILRHLPQVDGVGCHGSGVVAGRHPGLTAHLWLERVAETQET